MTKKNARVNSDEGRFLEAEEYVLATVAFVLSDAMERSGLTQRQVADRLGVSEARISQILNATGNPTVRSLARVAAALNCKVKFRFAELDAVERRRDTGVKTSPVAPSSAAAPTDGRPPHLVLCSDDESIRGVRTRPEEPTPSTENNHALAA